MGQVQKFQKCRFNGGCTRGTADPSFLCHKHRYSQKGYTRGGQLVFSSGGPLGIQPRLAMENTVIPPQGDDAMEIEGFPFFSVYDKKHYVDWSIGRAPRPSNADVIARYPIQVEDISGDQITGQEIGIYDHEGRLFTFDHDTAPIENTGSVGLEHIRIFRMEDSSSDGIPFAVSSNSVYQVVIFDRDKLGSHL